ncbi:MFS transporter [Catellatospora sp. TT07R-123]|uniref:MFS transporter n=1 Tax=Catellatospora sp. TT07R-123 TaxID=2733863 RepID=UPI001B29F121|nr:MFS transporter [Catellatospora sp. TT07R-123]GHJ42726.1 MFS transporter [Catellatospora sp. TT07R-123]
MTTATLPATGPAAPPAAPWRAMPILLIGAFLPILDAFIVNIALATIARDLHASPAALELTISGYGVVYACALVVGGRLGDRYGRRRMLVIGMSAFTVASAACGLAPTVALLIVFRLLQGGAAALLFPQVLASIQAGFAGVDRQRALGAFGAVAGGAAAVGQLLGGVLLAADVAGLSWRPLFLINVPVGLAAVLLAPRLVHESRSPVPARLDVRGAFGLAATIALLLLPLTIGRSQGWPLWSWLCLAAVVPAGALFTAAQARQERQGGSPLVPPSLLALPRARRALVNMLAFATLVGGFNFTLAITLQVAHGFGPLRAGLVMVPCALVFLAVSLRVNRWVAVHGARILVAGALLFAAGLAVFGAVVTGTDSALLMSLPLIVVGIGWSMVLTPAVGFSLAGLPTDRAGLAGGVLTTALQVGLAVGASLVGSLLFGVAGPEPTAASWRAGVLGAVGFGVVLALMTALASSRLSRR